MADPKNTSDALDEAEIVKTFTGDPEAVAAPEDEAGHDFDEADIDGADDEDPDDDSPEAIIAALSAENAELRDKMLRALADAENTRRRAMRERDDAEKFGGTRLARDLLSVLDNFDRALASVGDDWRESAKDFIEGVELTQRELLNAFAKHKIEPFPPAIGEKFDPNLHQAMFEAPLPRAEAGAVIQVMQNGFTIGGRLLRPAMVGVARAA